MFAFRNIIKVNMEENNKMVSIIVPIYNAETYIDRCVKSLIKQTYQNIEILLIDDGSKDSSGKICDEWKKIDSRIRVVHQNNKGVSSARNNGLCMARGQMISFIDVDDYVDENYIEKLYSVMLDTNVDIVTCNFEIEYEKDTSERKYKMIDNEHTIEREDEIFQDCIEGKIYTYLVWAKLFKKEILQGIFFTKQAYSEDACFVREVFAKGAKIRLITYKGYHYYIGSDNATNKREKSIEKTMGALNMLQETWHLCNEKHLNVSYAILEDLIIDTFRTGLILSIKRKKLFSEAENQTMDKIINLWPNIDSKKKKRYLLVLARIISLMSNRKVNRMKKKVGIITIYDMNNYGNRLQNYATVNYLSQKGFQVDTLIIKEYSVKKIIKRLLGKKQVEHWNVIQESKKYIETLNPLEKERYTVFRDFSYKYTNVRDVIYYKELKGLLSKQYDYFITGSDQVWNPTIGQAASWEFIAFAQKNKRISWAASFGIDEIPNKYIDWIRNNLSMMNHISVREDKAKEIVEQLTEHKAEVLIDPTMMISANEWREISRKPKNVDTNRNYLLTCFIGNKQENVQNEISELANKYNLSIYNLLDPNNKDLFVSGPSEFIYLIDHASVVLTDSFHASVFSFLLQKPFLVYKRESKEKNMMSRIETLLKKFDLERKYVCNNMENDIFECDYTKGYRILEMERNKADIFLNQALKC